MTQAPPPSLTSPPQRVACPHLGRLQAGRPPQARPSEAHRCFAAGPGGEPIGRRHQAQRCLSLEWPQCERLQPGYVPVRAIPVIPITPAPASPPTLSLASRRLLERSRAAPAAVVERAPVTVPPRPVPPPTPAPHAAGSWQSPLLWTAFLLPVLLFLVVLGLMAFVALSPARAAGSEVPPSVDRASATSVAEPDLAALVADTPVATFQPVSELPDAAPVAPTIPADPPPSRAEGPVRPGPWPTVPATGAPDRIRAPRVGIEAEVIPVGSYTRQEGGQLLRFYEVAEYAAGWHTNSSLPGFQGNVVLAGHHNTKGKVFEGVVELEPGDFVFLDIDDEVYPYLVVVKEIFPETTVSEAQRNENGRWIAQTEDERLTLVTCWPPNGNSHRVVVVAIPAK